jgi:hypothetical protein
VGAGWGRAGGQRATPSVCTQVGTIKGGPGRQKLKDVMESLGADITKTKWWRTPTTFYEAYLYPVSSKLAWDWAVGGVWGWRGVGAALAADWPSPMQVGLAWGGLSPADQNCRSSACFAGEGHAAGVKYPGPDIIPICLQWSDGG